MCVMAYIPSGKGINKDTLEDMWDKNPDGGGFMYVSSTGSLVVKKGYFKFKSWYDAYSKHRKSNKGKAFIVHMRITTGGKNDWTNSHPHIIDKEWAFAHNGIIGEMGKFDQKIVSDTVHFNEKIIQNLPDKWWTSEGIKMMMAKYIGESKLVFMNNKEEVFIINEQKGEWDGGVWYSNKNHECLYGGYSTASYGGWSGHHYDTWKNKGTSNTRPKPAKSAKSTKTKITPPPPPPKQLPMTDLDGYIDVSDNTEKPATKASNCCVCSRKLDKINTSTFESTEEYGVCVSCAYQLANEEYDNRNMDIYDYFNVESEYLDWRESTGFIQGIK